jgi:serine protease inhibitor
LSQGTLRHAALPPRDQRITGLEGPGSGWVAIADKDGEPWIALAQGSNTGADIAMADVARAPGDPADAARAGASINAFGLDLHRRLITDKQLDLGDRNVVFSPTSIALALAMARGGAKGETATEMDRVLYTAGWSELADGLNALEQALASRSGAWKDSEGSKELTLRTANAAFAQKGWTVEPAYLDAIASAFGSGLRLVDYVGDLPGARQTINKWVSDRTAKRIPELLGPDDLTPDTRLTLVNAIYLKAQWTEWFDEQLTKPARFTRLDGSRVKVPTMRRWGGQVLPYARGKDWQATELRYLGPDPSHQLAMLLVLPDDLKAFEASLTDKKLGRITAAVTAETERQADGVDCPGVPHDQQDATPRPHAVHAALRHRDASRDEDDPHGARDAAGVPGGCRGLHGDQWHRAVVHLDGHPPGQHRCRREGHRGRGGDCGRHGYGRWTECRQGHHSAT